MDTDRELHRPTALVEPPADEGAWVLVCAEAGDD